MFAGGIHQHPGPCLPSPSCVGAHLLLQKYLLSLFETEIHGNYYMLLKPYFLPSVDGRQKWGWIQLGLLWMVEMIPRMVPEE